MSERPIVPDLDVGLGIASVLGLASIADQAVLPGVNHCNLQSVPAGLERIGDFQAERLGPGDADVLAVEQDGSNAYVLDFVELQPETLTTVRFQYKGIHIGCLA